MPLAIGQIQVECLRLPSVVSEGGYLDYELFLSLAAIIYYTQDRNR